MANFIRIKLTCMDDYDFGQHSKATSKTYFKIPFKFFHDERFIMATHEARIAIIYLLHKSQMIGSSTFVCSRMDLGLSPRRPHNVVTSQLHQLKLIEIIDDAVTVKRREEKKREENRIEDSEKKSLISDSQKPLPKEMPSAAPPSEELGKQCHQVISRYCELWKLKYKTNPAFSNKWAGNAKTLVKDHGVSKAIHLVEAFMEMNDSWFLENRHSFELILTKLASVAHFAGTGVQVTRSQIKQIDRTQTNINSAEGAKQLLRAGSAK